MANRTTLLQLTHPSFQFIQRTHYNVKCLFGRSESWRKRMETQTWNAVISPIHHPNQAMESSKHTTTVGTVQYKQPP